MHDDDDRDSMEENQKKPRRRRDKTWCVCYNLAEDRKRWWISKVRAPSEDEAKTKSVKKLKKEGKIGIEIVYAKCIDDVDNVTKKRRIDGEETTVDPVSGR